MFISLVISSLFTYFHLFLTQFDGTLDNRIRRLARFHLKTAMFDIQSRNIKWEEHKELES